jgi:O-antigen/teichoic acid export membrane protein
MKNMGKHLANVGSLVKKTLAFSRKESAHFLFLTLAAQGLSSIAPFLVAKILSPEIFGQYSLSLMVAFLFLSFLIGSFKTPFIVHLGMEHKARGKINRTILGWLMSYLVCIPLYIVAMLVFKNPIGEFTGLGTNVFIIHGIFAGLIIKEILATAFLAKNKKRRSAAVELTFNAAYVSIIIILWGLNALTMQGIALGYLLAGFILLPIFLRKRHFSSILPVDFDKIWVKEIFAFAQWQVLGLSAMFLVNWGDNLVLRYYVSMDEIGIYNFAYKIFLGISNAVMIINLYFLPVLAAKIDDRVFLRDYFEKTQRRFVLLGSLLLVPILALLSALIAWLFEPYRSAIPIVWILGLCLVMLTRYSFYAPYLNVLKKYRYLQTVNVAHVAVNLLFDLALIPYWGIAGAAYATVLGYTAKLILIEIYMRRHRKANPSE